MSDVTNKKLVIEGVVAAAVIYFVWLMMEVFWWSSPAAVGRFLYENWAEMFLFKVVLVLLMVTSAFVHNRPEAIRSLVNCVHDWARSTG
ncbi:MAG: hypothetical protein KC877_03170 [Candidatus Kaiserbacteria bacterium]|nr:hypothetical protein [Candidatus Kaiserbacteria bacterium]MCB9815795.1 hypothetical protein [Candidatus Nomurabacteria bacterium]